MSKKITELQLIASITDSLNLPADNGIQTYRATALQLKNYILQAADVEPLIITADKTANYTAVARDLVMGDATSGNITITLPTASSNTHRMIGVMKIDSSANAVIVNSVELNVQNDFQIYKSDGTDWILIHDYLAPYKKTYRKAGDFFASSPTAGVWQNPDSSFKVDVVKGQYDLRMQGVIGPNVNTSTTGNQISLFGAFATDPTGGTGQVGHRWAGHSAAYTTNNMLWNTMNYVEEAINISSASSIYFHFAWENYSGSPTITQLGFRSLSGTGNFSDPIISATRIGR